MSAFADDFVELHLSIGTPRIMLPSDIDWPPPEFIMFDDNVLREATKDDPRDEIMRRVRHSQITDEQRAKMSHVCRGAEYQYVVEIMEGQEVGVH